MKFQFGKFVGKIDVWQGACLVTRWRPPKQPTRAPTRVDFPFTGCPCTVQFGYGLGVERFERLRFSVPVVPLKKGVSLCFSTI